jgi:hypothetical protein
METSVSSSVKGIMMISRRVAVAHVCLLELGLLGALLPALPVSAQQPPAPATTTKTSAADKIAVPFSDPSRPGMLRVGLISGSIHVTGYQGKEVLIEAVTAENEDRAEAGRQGLRRIPNTTSGLVVEEERNEMRVSSSIPHRTIALTIQVPIRTSLNLSTVNNGDIVIERVDGDMEVNNTNGAVTLSEVSGTVVAHALNADVTASFVRLSGKPMSFSSLNGNLDVRLPATVKANLRLETNNGEVYSDFPIDILAPSFEKTTEDNRSTGGKYRIKIEQAMIGRLNGGGAEISFKTFNGSIYLRRAG